MREMSRRDYELQFPTPLPYERSLYNLGITPSSERHYKNLTADGLAYEFVKFERLYDTNYQAYEWLYHTEYGYRLYKMIGDVLSKDRKFESAHELSTEVIKCINRVREFENQKEV